ncbi:putative glucuronokinase 2 [Glycine max]|nr:putative glucuronokinase 2 [Glycine max]
MGMRGWVCSETQAMCITAKRYRLASPTSAPPSRLVPPTSPSTILATTISLPPTPSIFLARLMFGGDALGDLNLKMVEVARKVGAASKFTQKEGFVILPIEPFLSRLNEIDLKTLQIK